LYIPFLHYSIDILTVLFVARCCCVVDLMGDLEPSHRWRQVSACQLIKHLLFNLSAAPGKSALVLFYHVNVCALLYLTDICLCLTAFASRMY